MPAPRRRSVRSIIVTAAIAVAAILGAGSPALPAGAQTEVERDPATFEHVAALDELTSQHAAVLRLYWVYFDRVPDPEGALYWLDQFEQCVSLYRIADFFTSSPEFVQTYGDLSTADFVDLVYRNALDRLPDDGGRSYWIDLLDIGRISRTDLMVLFSESEEFRVNHPLPSDAVPGRGCRRSTPPTLVVPREYEIRPWPVFATIGPVELHMPSAAAELVGFHESNHDGAQAIDAVGSDIPWLVMSSRNRDTHPRGAVDIAAHPLMEVRAPVTGTVVRAGGYVLYCRHTDDYAVIEPDDRPGWEVKVLHISEVQVRTGDRVIAGETVLAAAPNQLPFTSQIDRHTGEPSWPHVHIEVVDPSIPDRPSPGGGC